MPINPRDGWTMTAGRIDWKTERDRIDLAAVMTKYLGPAPGRRGEHGRRLWWRCPLHQDRNPSFCVDPGKPHWRCFGCGEHGDAATLVMKLEGVSFPEALDILLDRPRGKAPGRPPVRPVPSDSRSAHPAAPRPAREIPDSPPKMLTPEAATALVQSAADWLWTPEGAAALAYLTGRGLTPETIRAARLGVTGPIAELTGRPRGIVIPWFDGDRLALVKIRQPEGVKPKYREAFRDRDRPPELYPGPETIQPGEPLIIVEGEFDALLLGQALGELAAVLTLGSASAGPDTGILGALLSAPAWYIAHDADAAGDRAAAHWTTYPRARRVRPPGSFKDWTEAASPAPGSVGTGMDLSRWWAAVLSGVPDPPTFTPGELTAWRWGPALADEPEG
jgi:DNA primase